MNNYVFTILDKNKQSMEQHTEAQRQSFIYDEVVAIAQDLDMNPEDVEADPALYQIAIMYYEENTNTQ